MYLSVDARSFMFGRRFANATVNAKLVGLHLIYDVLVVIKGDRL